MRGSGRPVWEDEAPASRLAALSPPFPDPLPRTPDVLVVGGGIVGLAVAASCSARGMRPLVVEREERLGVGASGRAAGGLAPDAHPEAGAAWREVARWSLERHVELGRLWGYSVEMLDLRIAEGGVVPRQGRVDPLEAMAAFARQAGAVACGVEVTGWSEGFETVRTTGGELAPGAVVFATGTTPVGHVHQSFVKGHLVATSPAPFVLGEIVATADAQFLCLQTASGRLVVGGTKEPEDGSEAVVASTVQRITSTLRRLVPAAERLEVTHRWCCFRPHAAGGRAVVDRVAQRAWVACGFFSTGILMAPAAGELVAEWMAGERPWGLEAFAPAKASP